MMQYDGELHLPKHFLVRRGGRFFLHATAAKRVFMQDVGELHLIIHPCLTQVLPPSLATLHSTALPHGLVLSSAGAAPAD